jgi:hypothetical protein
LVLIGNLSFNRYCGRGRPDATLWATLFPVYPGVSLFEFLTETNRVSRLLGDVQHSFAGCVCYEQPVVVARFVALVILGGCVL